MLKGASRVQIPPSPLGAFKEPRSGGALSRDNGSRRCRIQTGMRTRLSRSWCSPPSSSASGCAGSGTAKPATSVVWPAAVDPAGSTSVLVQSSFRSAPRGCAGCDPRRAARFLSSTRLAIAGVAGSSNCPSVPDKLVVRSPHAIRWIWSSAAGARQLGARSSLAGHLLGRSRPDPGRDCDRPAADRRPSPAESQPLLPQDRHSPLQAPGRLHGAAASHGSGPRRSAGRPCLGPRSSRSSRRCPARSAASSPTTGRRRGTTAGSARRASARAERWSPRGTSRSPRAGAPSCPPAADCPASRLTRHHTWQVVEGETIVKPGTKPRVYATHSRGATAPQGSR